MRYIRLDMKRFKIFLQTQYIHQGHNSSPTTAATVKKNYRGWRDNGGGKIISTLLAPLPYPPPQSKQVVNGNLIKVVRTNFFSLGILYDVVSHRKQRLLNSARVKIGQEPIGRWGAFFFFFFKKSFPSLHTGRTPLLCKFQQQQKLLIQIWYTFMYTSLTVKPILLELVGFYWRN